MRHIFHEILARYLESEQHAFETSPRELWPDTGYVPRWAGGPAKPASDSNSRARIYREFGPQEGT